jgi:cell division protein FtsW (lipid II flippase)
MDEIFIQRTVNQFFTKGENQMKLKYLFYFQALTVLNAMGMIFAPSAELSGAGISPSAELNLALQNTGGLLLFLSLVAFFAARAEDSPFRRNIRLCFFIGHLVLFAVYAFNQVNGGPTFGPILWIHLVFALAFGYFQFIKPDA